MEEIHAGRVDAIEINRFKSMI